MLILKSDITKHKNFRRLKNEKRRKEMKKRKALLWLTALAAFLVVVLAGCGNGYKVTFAAGENGTLAAVSNGEAIESGSKVGAGEAIEFEATPASGYAVGMWTVNGKTQTEGLDETGTKLTLKADKELEVSVTFRRRSEERRVGKECRL